MKNWSIRSKLLGERDPGMAVKRRVQQLAWPANKPQPDVTRFGNPPHAIPPIATLGQRVVLAIQEKVWLALDLLGQFSPRLQLQDKAWQQIEFIEARMLTQSRIEMMDKATEDMVLTGGVFTPRLALGDASTQTVTMFGDAAALLRFQDKATLQTGESGVYSFTPQFVDGSIISGASNATEFLDGEYYLPYSRDYTNLTVSFSSLSYGLVVVPTAVEDNTNLTVGFSSIVHLPVVLTAEDINSVSLTVGFTGFNYSEVVQPTVSEENAAIGMIFMGGTHTRTVQAADFIQETGHQDSSFAGGSHALP